MSRDPRVRVTGRSFAVEVFCDERWESLASWEISKHLPVAEAQREVDVWIALVEKIVSKQVGRPVRLVVPKSNP